ncbi:HD domain-containing protein [Bacillaceae bacterium IKA-2]|nr:HD domain-containing protein [Bacillaceae bacterium IKA-2]
MEKISFELVGKVLEEDVVSDLDVLLLTKGTILTKANILLLKKQYSKKVKVSEDLSFKNLYLKNIKHIEHLFSFLEKTKSIDMEEWFHHEQIVRFVQKDASFIEQMYEIKAQSSLYVHSVNVGLIAFFLGKLLRYSYREKLHIWKMGVLHDIGKLKLDSELLFKQEEELTEEELHEYKQHPNLGLNILSEVKGVNAEIVSATKFHHEQIDGSGYPNKVKVNCLPVTVQIVSVANRIDKIISANRNPFHLVNLLIEETRENKLNPAITIPFVRHTLRKYVGKKIVLNDETKAEIVFIFDHEPTQPLIYLNERKMFIDLRENHKLKIKDFA